MQNTSLDHIDHLRLKNFFRKLCIVSVRRAKKGHAASELGTQFDNETERELRIRIKQLEEELRQAVEEKNSALKENRNKIRKLSIALLSIKTEVGRLIKAKEE